MGTAYNVLIVDNAPYARERLKSLLESHGHKVVGEAQDTATATELYQKLKPDVMTLDLLLTGEHGFRILIAIRKIDPHARVIVVSALNDYETMKKATQLGAAAFVTKAEDWPQIEAALKQAMSTGAARPPAKG